LNEFSFILCLPLHEYIALRRNAVPQKFFIQLAWDGRVAMNLAVCVHWIWYMAFHFGVRSVDIAHG
jgi:hypothetical protein